MNIYGGTRGWKKRKFFFHFISHLDRSHFGIEIWEVKRNSSPPIQRCSTHEFDIWPGYIDYGESADTLRIKKFLLLHIDTAIGKNGNYLPIIAIIDFEKTRQNWP
jgi:hypothetical protein